MQRLKGSYALVLLTKIKYRLRDPKACARSRWAASSEYIVASESARLTPSARSSCGITNRRDRRCGKSGAQGLQAIRRRINALCSSNMSILAPDSDIDGISS